MIVLLALAIAAGLFLVLWSCCIVAGRADDAMERAYRSEEPDHDA